MAGLSQKRPSIRMPAAISGRLARPPEAPFSKSHLEIKLPSSGAEVSFEQEKATLIGRYARVSTNAQNHYASPLIAIVGQASSSSRLAYGSQFWSYQPCPLPRTSGSICT